MCPFISEQDQRLDVINIKYQGETGKVLSHLAKPKQEEKLPGVVVIHENRGLNPHTEDVARRIALEGFIAIAPNALSPLGGTPDDVDEARTLMRQLDSEKTIKNFVAAVKYLKTHPQSTGKVGVTGFCWGGGLTNQVAVNSSEVQAAVPFYGRQPSPEDVPQIKASLLIHYAGDDERINEGIPAFEEALKKASVEYKIHIYDSAKHGFFNDTSQRYHPEASKLVWERTIAFFKEKLKT
jgi:carboxymethylenebutenolidase